VAVVVVVVVGCDDGGWENFPSEFFPLSCGGQAWLDQRVWLRTTRRCL